MTVTAPAPTGGLHGSARWFLGYHALTVLQYDLTGDSDARAPSPAFDERAAARPLPQSHRRHGLVYGCSWAACRCMCWSRCQIRQYLTGAGVRGRPMPRDRGYAADNGDAPTDS